MIVRVKRKIMQNRNGFYFEFSVESSSFIFNNFKWKTLSLPGKVETDQFIICVVLPECLSVKICCTSPSAVKRIVMALMLSLHFSCLSLFLPHLRTLAQEKRSENCLRFGTGGPSLFVSIIAEAICSRYQRALSRF